MIQSISRENKMSNDYFSLGNDFKNIINDEINHIIMEFAKLVKDMTLSEISNFVGNNVTKKHPSTFSLPTKIKIYGKPKNIDPVKLKTKCMEYVNKFGAINAAVFFDFPDFAQLLFNSARQELDIVHQVLFDYKQNLNPKIIDEKNHYYRIYNENFKNLSDPNVRDNSFLESPLLNYFNEGSCDKEIIYAIYVRLENNKDSAPKLLEKLWATVFKTICTSHNYQGNTQNARCNMMDQFTAKENNAGDDKNQIESEESIRFIRNEKLKQKVTTFINQAKISVNTSLPKMIVEENLESMRSVVANLSDEVDRIWYYQTINQFRGRQTSKNKQKRNEFENEIKEKIISFSGLNFIITLFHEMIENLKSFTNFKKDTNKFLKNKLTQRSNEVMNNSTWSDTRIRQIKSIFIKCLCIAARELQSQNLPNEKWEKWLKNLLNLIS